MTEMGIAYESHSNRNIATALTDRYPHPTILTGFKGNWCGQLKRECHLFKLSYSGLECLNESSSIMVFPFNGNQVLNSIIPFNRIKMMNNITFRQSLLIGFLPNKNMLPNITLFCRPIIVRHPKLNITLTFYYFIRISSLIKLSLLRSRHLGITRPANTRDWCFNLPTNLAFTPSVYPPLILPQPLETCWVICFRTFWTEFLLRWFGIKFLIASWANSYSHTIIYTIHLYLLSIRI